MSTGFPPLGISLSHIDVDIHGVRSWQLTVITGHLLLLVIFSTNIQSIPIIQISNQSPSYKYPISPYHTNIQSIPIIQTSHLSQSYKYPINPHHTNIQSIPIIQTSILSPSYKYPINLHTNIKSIPNPNHANIQSISIIQISNQSPSYKYPINPHHPNILIPVWLSTAVLVWDMDCVLWFMLQYVVITCMETLRCCLCHCRQDPWKSCWTKIGTNRLLLTLADHS